MKKITKLFALALGMMAIACNKPEIGPEEEVIPEGMIKVTFTASQGTKTSMQENGDIYWSAEDAIGVVYDNSVYKFEITDYSDENPSTATFSGLAPAGVEPAVAYYPYVNENLASYLSNIPTEQNYAGTTFDTETLPMVATVNGDALEFTASAVVVMVPGIYVKPEDELTLTSGVFAAKMTIPSDESASVKDLIFVMPAGSQSFTFTKGDDSWPGVTSGSEVGKRYKLILGYKGDTNPMVYPEKNGDVINVTAANAQYVLDGAFGSIDGKTINFTENITESLIIGRPSKYAGSNTEYRADSFTADPKEYAEFINYKNQTSWTPSCYYRRSVNNVTLTSAEGVTLKGFVCSWSGHCNGTNVLDCVRDIVIANGSAYYVADDINGVTFKGLTLTSKTDIAGAIAESGSVNNVKFQNCIFNIGNTTSGNQAIRYYNENNTEQVTNLVVTGCEFNECYQAVYTAHIKGIDIENNTVVTTGHNAFAIQTSKGAFNHGVVKIIGNTIEKCNDRAIRFGDVANGTSITITGNNAYYGESAHAACDEESIKATTIADGVTTTVYGNNWNNFKEAFNSKLRDAVAKIGSTSYPTLAAALIAAQSGEVIEVLNGTWGADAIGQLDAPGTYTNQNSVRYKSLTIQPATGATPVFTANVSLGYDDSSTANATMTVKNLKFNGASLQLSNYVQATVEGCTFENGTSATNGVLIIQDACCTNHKTAGDYPASQITIKNCSITGSNTGASCIRVRNSGNVTIDGCTIANSKFNGILFESNSSVDKTPAKAIELKGNTITEWNSTNASGQGRGIRLALGTLAADSTVKLTNNIFTKATLGLDTPDFAKITGLGSGVVTLSGNTWNNMSDDDVKNNSNYYTVAQ